MHMLQDVKKSWLYDRILLNLTMGTWVSKIIAGGLTTQRLAYSTSIQIMCMTTII